MLVLKMHEMPWYLLSQKNQKAYEFILKRLQDGAVLRIRPFAELSFATFTDVMNHPYFHFPINFIQITFFQMTKMIYSFLMMLLKALK